MPKLDQLDTRLCPSCNRKRPITAFMGLPVDKRCDICLSGPDFDRIEERKLARVEEQMARLMDATKSDVVNVPKFDRFLSAFIRDGGGVNQLSLRLWRLLDKLENKKAEGAAAQILSTMLKRWLEQERLEHDKEEDQLNREQVEKQRQLVVLQILGDLAKSETHREMLGSLLEASGIGHLAPPVVEGQK